MDDILQALELTMKEKEKDRKPGFFIWLLSQLSGLSDTNVPAKIFALEANCHVFTKCRKCGKLNDSLPEIELKYIKNLSMGSTRRMYCTSCRTNLGRYMHGNKKNYIIPRNRFNDHTRAQKDVKMPDRLNGAVLRTLNNTASGLKE
jgi:hypothetical protein